jgi:hypothetical protein
MAIRFGTSSQKAIIAGEAEFIFAGDLQLPECSSGAEPLVRVYPKTEI